MRLLRERITDGLVNTAQFNHNLESRLRRENGSVGPRSTGRRQDNTSHEGLLSSHTYLSSMRSNTFQFSVSSESRATATWSCQASQTTHIRPLVDSWPAFEMWPSAILQKPWKLLSEWHKKRDSFCLCSRDAVTMEGGNSAAGIFQVTEQIFASFPLVNSLTKTNSVVVAAKQINQQLPTKREAKWISFLLARLLLLVKHSSISQCFFGWIYDALKFYAMYKVSDRHPLTVSNLHLWHWIVMNKHLDICQCLKHLIWWRRLTVSNCLMRGATFGNFWSSSTANAFT